MADSISIYSLDTPQTESPPLPDLPERSKRRRIQVQPIPNAPFPTPEPEEKPSCRQWLLHAISDYTSPVTIAAKRFYKALLNPRAPNPDIELGEPSSTIPAHDGTVADPEPRRNLPTDPKTKSEIPSQRFKERFWFTDDPGFKAFIREAWPDLITMAVCFGVAAAIYAWAKPLTPEYFLLSQSQYAHPKLDEYITTTVSAVISFGVPFIFIGLCGIFLIGSFWDTNSALMGLGFAICTANICQIFMKLFIGGLRPHFLVVCKPPLNPLGHGFGGKYLSPDICKTRGHALNIAMMSFPSGHSAAAFAGFGFLALWVNAKFKVCADYKSRHWQTLMLATPIVIATVLALSKVADYWHHWYDVLVGSLIGIFWAILCYRQMFLSVLDWRTNHIPLFYLSDPNISNFDNQTISHRHLTCINFAGWRNKYSPNASHPTAENPVNESTTKSPNSSHKGRASEQVNSAKDNPWQLPQIPEYRSRPRFEVRD